MINDDDDECQPAAFESFEHMAAHFRGNLARDRARSMAEVAVWFDLQAAKLEQSIEMMRRSYFDVTTQ